MLEGDLVHDLAGRGVENRRLAGESSTRGREQQRRRLGAIETLSTAIGALLQNAERQKEPSRSKESALQIEHPMHSQLEAVTKEEAQSLSPVVLRQENEPLPRLVGVLRNVLRACAKPDRQRAEMGAFRSTSRDKRLDQEGRRDRFGARRET